MYNLRRMLNKFKVLLFLVSFFVVFRYVNTKVNAASGYSKDCIKEVGEYTKALVDEIEAKGGLTHIKLLSPVVNLTYDDGVGNASITLNALAEGAGSAWGKLDGIAGNAYNIAGGNTITGYINSVRANPNLGNRPLMVTEIGWYPHETNKNLPLLRSEINALKGDSKIIGALIFNVFGTNPGFMGQAMTDPEISQVCSGSCGKIGANSAKYYTTNEIYPRAGGLGMGYTLEITNINDGTSVALEGINLAFNNGAIPIIRVGVGDDGGGAEDPTKYAAYLKEMDGKVSSKIYAISPPNKP